jgi:hypothetical protein
MGIGGGIKEPIFSPLLARVQPPWQKPFRGKMLNLTGHLARGLVVSFPFNEISGDRLFNYAQSKACPIVGATWESSERGSCLNIDPTDEYVTVGTLANDSYLPSTGDFTFSAWVSVDDYTASLCIVAFAASDSQCFWSITINYGGDDGYLHYWPDNANRDLQSNFQFSNTDWVHVVVTRKNTASIRMYINGVLDASTDAAGSPGSPGTVELSLGVFGLWRGYDFDGRMQSVNIWNRALSAAEAGRVYSESFTTFKK